MVSAVAAFGPFIFGRFKFQNQASVDGAGLWHGDLDFPFLQLVLIEFNAKAVAFG